MGEGGITEVFDRVRSGEVQVKSKAFVKRIDLAATQVIIAAGKKTRELKKVVRLIGVNPQVKKLLTLAGIKA